MEEFNITYEDLIKAHKNKEAGFDEAYEPILSIKDSLENLDLIIDFVRRWDSHVPMGRNIDKIKEVVLSLKREFESLNDHTIENFEFNLNNRMIIKNIFNTLMNIKLISPKKITSFGPIGASKLMHCINPSLFIMWDNGICEHYGCYPNSVGYIHFMKLMQEVIKVILKEHIKDDIIKETDRTLPKLIDEYNWMNFSTSKNENT